MLSLLSLYIYGFYIVKLTHPNCPKFVIIGQAPYFNKGGQGDDWSGRERKNKKSLFCRT